MIANILIVLIFFILMEFVAWLTHRYIMHGPLWFLHRDHHLPDKHSTFQRNDLFFLIFATPGIILIYIGAQSDWTKWQGFAGIGISLYGMIYFFIHEVFIHRRLKFMNHIKNRYLIALKRGHAAHHKVTSKDGCVCFGMLIVPIRFFKRG